MYILKTDTRYKAIEIKHGQKKDGSPWMLVRAAREDGADMRDYTMWVNSPPVEVTTGGWFKITSITAVKPIKHEWNGKLYIKMEVNVSIVPDGEQPESTGMDTFTPIPNDDDGDLPF